MLLHKDRTVTDNTRFRILLYFTLSLDDQDLLQNRPSIRVQGTMSIIAVSTYVLK